jgi:O-methyltransferase involved in polyketide biosynthesis
MIGAGTNVENIDPGPGVRWFDVDQPHVIVSRLPVVRDIGHVGQYAFGTDATDSGAADSGATADI